MDNIVKIKFEEWQNEVYDRGELWVSHYGQVLQVEGLTLPDGNIEVHFSLTEYTGDAHPYIGTVKDNVLTVNIPDFIFQKENLYNSDKYEAYAFIYQTDETSGRTIKKITFTIKARPDVSADVPEDKKDQFLNEVRQVMQKTKDIAQSVRDDADAGKFNGTGEIDEEQLLKFAIKSTTDKAPFHRITDSANYRVLDFGMEGKTEQETTEGNQLFDKSTIVDGVLDVDGTIISGAGYFTSDYILVNTGESYYCTRTGSLRGKYFDSDKNPIMTDTYSDFSLESGGTVIVPDNAVYIRFSVYKDYTDSVMFNKGTTALPYEPFTNGPSPNPDYPQEIVNAGKLGKNLWNAEYASDFDNWGTVSYRYIAVPVKKGATVSISHAKELNEGLGFYCCIGKEAGTTNNVYKWIYHTSSPTNISNSFSIVAVDDIIYLNLAGNFEAFMENINYDLQIEISDTPTDYEPFRYEIGCRVGNKNLFDLGKASNNQNYVSGENHKYFPVYVGKGNIVTFSCAFPAEYDDTVYIRDSIDGNLLTYIWHPSVQDLQKENVTITSPNDYIYIKGGDNWINYLSNIQIELGSESTTYTPHQSTSFTLTSPVPITKWDKLIKRDGVWGWSIWSGMTDDLASLVSDNLTIYGSEGDKYISGIKIPGVTNFNYDVTLMVSEVGVQKKRLYQPSVRTDSILMHVADDDTVASVKEHLHYKVQWKTDTEQSFHPLPDEEQELLNNLETYYGVTNVYNDQGCLMWLTYVANTKLYVDKKILEIQQAMI